MTFDYEINKNKILEKFQEYYELRNLDISGEKYTNAEAVVSGAMEYIHDKYIKDYIPNLICEKPNCDDISLIRNLSIIADAYINIINAYNILSFSNDFEILIKANNKHMVAFMEKLENKIDMGGMVEDMEKATIYLCDRLKKIYKELSGEKSERKLSLTQMGNMSLANNDRKVGLEYLKQDRITQAELQSKITLDSLPDFNKNTNKLIDKNE